MAKDDNRKILGEMSEDELLDYRAEMSDLAEPYLERIRAIDVRLNKIKERQGTAPR